MFGKTTLFASALFIVVGLPPANAQGGNQVQYPQPDALPQEGEISLVSGFTPDPHEVSVWAGGKHRVSIERVSSCSGEVDVRPNLNLVWAGGSFYVYAEASEDLVLLINDAKGNYHCNDISILGENPLIKFNDAPPGRYNMFVGTFSGGGRVKATLKITEIEPD